MDVLVSVVIPTHNRARLVRRAIESVLQQTYTSFELIVFNDGSTDETAAVLGEYAAEDSRVRLFHSDVGHGAAVARNRAVELARGRYVAFLDDDDEWLPTKLARQVGALDQAGEEAGLCYCPYFYVPIEGSTRMVGTFDPARAQAYRMIFRRNFIALPTVLLRRDLFRAAGGFDERLPQVEDWDLWIRLAAATKYVVVPEPLVRVYATPGSMSMRAGPLLVARDILLDKIGTRVDVARAERANFIYALGHELVVQGAKREGRALLLQALRMRPWPLQRFGVVLSTYMGGRAYAAARWLRVVTLELAWRWRHRNGRRPAEVIRTGIERP